MDAIACHLVTQLVHLKNLNSYWMETQFGTDILSAQMMNHEDACNLLTFPLAPSTCRTFRIFCEIS